MSLASLRAAIGSPLELEDRITTLETALGADESSWNQNFLSNGQTYYVNNITGNDSTHTGLGGWSDAFATISHAIAVAEVYRLAQLAGNTMVRNTILVAGTSTAYAAISALPNWTNVIGVGAYPFGNGSGIAIVDGAGAADAVAGTCRGNYFKNLQFCASGAYWSFNGVQVLRTIFEDVCFRNNAAASNGGFKVTGNSGGIVMRRCRFDGDSGYPAYGIYVTGGVTFNSCTIEDCFITGTTNGVYIGASTDAIGSLFKNNFIGDMGGGCTLAINDLGAGYAVFAGNYCFASTPGISLTARPGRAVSNHLVIVNGTGSIVASGS
jgi:hypothetical protein